MKGAQEIVAVLIGEERIVQSHFWNPRKGSENQIFDAGLRRCGHRDGVAIAAEPGCDPEHIHLRDRGGAWWSCGILRGGLIHSLPSLESLAKLRSSRPGAGHPGTWRPFY